MFEDQHDEEGWGLSDAQDHEFIPLISAEDEEAMQKEEVPEALPLLSLRNTVLRNDRRGRASGTSSFCIAS